MALLLASGAVSALLIGAILVAPNLLGWDAALDGSLWVTFSLGVAGALLLALLVAWIIDRQVIKPVRSIAGIMEQLAAGHQDVEIPAGGRGDEIGVMARSLSIIRDTGIKAVQARAAFDNASTAAVMTAADGGVVHANKAARQFFAEAESDMRAVFPNFSGAALDKLS